MATEVKVNTALEIANKIALAFREDKNLAAAHTIQAFGEAVRVCRRSTWHVAIMASDIDKKKIWAKGDNYDSFDQFLANYGLKPATVRTYIWAFERLIDRGISAEEISDIPPGVGLLLSVNPDPKKYLDMAKTCSYTDVRRELSEHAGKSEREIEDEIHRTKACPHWKNCARFKEKV